MENKFVLVSLNDKKLKQLSEVLQNKTCKKIIDYLTNESEASEGDLVDNLTLPASSVHYSIKKLLESGLVEKTKTNV